MASLAFAPSPARADGGVESQLLDASDTMDIAGLQDRFAAIAKKVAPAVVAISASENLVATPAANRHADLTPQRLAAMLNETTRTVGTGFIINPDGYIVTNAHVVETAKQLWITTDDRKVYPAMLVGCDSRADLAVLKIPVHDLPAVDFAPAAHPRRGQWAITIGNPYGYATEGEMAVSVGVISATDRSLPGLAAKENRLYSNLLQTTAQINPGNSGGPLFDITGKVVGINTAVILPQKQINGIAFAIPITPELLDELSNLAAGKEIVYGYLGIVVETATPGQLQVAGVNRGSGVVVQSVEANSPAAGPGRLRRGDLLVAMNGQSIADADHFVRQVGTSPVDQPAKMELIRAGKLLTTLVKPTRRPEPMALNAASPRLHWHGLLFGSAPANWHTPASGNPTGVVVLAVEKQSPAIPAAAVGAILQSVAGHPIRSIEQLQQIINDTPESQCVMELQPVDTESAAAH